MRFTSGIICGSGSFAVQFGDHFRSGDHLRRCTVLLKCAMYVDILERARQLSLVSQSTNEINIIQQVEKVESTLKQYQIMQRRVQETDAVATSALPTVKHVLSVIEKEGPSNVRQQSRYQGVPVSNVEQSKAAINGLVNVMSTP